MKAPQWPRKPVAECTRAERLAEARAERERVYGRPTPPPADPPSVLQDTAYRGRWS